MNEEHRTLEIDALLTAFIYIRRYVDCCILVGCLPTKDGIFLKHRFDSLTTSFTLVSSRLFQKKKEGNIKTYSKHYSHKYMEGSKDWPPQASH